MRIAVLSVSPLEFALAALVWALVLGAAALGAPQAGEAPETDAVAPDPPAAAADPAAGDAPPAVDPVEAERRAVWESPEMRFARAWLEEYFRTSRQSPPAVERAYLDRLSRLSADEMRAWLQQMSMQHRQIAQENRRFAAARRQVVENAASQRTPAPISPRVPSSGGYNYVQPLSVQRPFSGPAYDPRYNTLRSFEIVHYLDTLQIREDLYDLRNSSR